ncbi:hypothetical protein FACS1894130_09860 [Spirochaetia bacterium]|nr:hypothetical protein FACS1894130_09860 [Spirochaetia bacterium]
MSFAIDDRYIEGVYAGWLGKAIGIRLGAPVEMWTAEEIAAKYKGQDGYLVDYGTFAADDDSNGPIFFFRTLRDYGITRDPKQRDFGLTWLNYASRLHGFFWWGGYGVSSEHTAYENLRFGVHAPISGSAAKNGKMLSEQIGGQIFSDTWGLAAPGDTALAASLAEKAARVSHDGAAVEGARFVAACISAAFTVKDVDKLIDAGLKQISADGSYARCVKSIVDFHRANKDAPETCFQFIRQNYWKDKYGGNCHIIPNIAIMIYALVYGRGEFDASLKLCNEAGFDTDCNAGNLGCILGVFNGLEKINYTKWRAPINDITLCSSAIGGLNIVDIPGFVFEIAAAAEKLAGATYQGKYRAALDGASPRFNFQLPGSTHGFVKKDDEIARYAYYRPQDLYDNRYDPCFTPEVFPGQTIRFTVTGGSGASACAFAEDIHAADDPAGNSEKLFLGGKKPITGVTELSVSIPPGRGITILRYGVKLFNADGSERILSADITGLCDYVIDFAQSALEEFALAHTEVREFTHHSGYWTLENGKMAGSCSDRAECYTGNYYTKDFEFEGELEKRTPGKAGLLFRVQGAVRSYAAMLTENGAVELLKNNNGYRLLAEAPLPPGAGTKRVVKVSGTGGSITVSVDGTVLIQYEDREPYTSGCFGIALQDGCSAELGYVRIKGIPQ